MKIILTETWTFRIRIPLRTSVLLYQSFGFRGATSDRYIPLKNIYSPTWNASAHRQIRARTIFAFAMSRERRSFWGWRRRTSSDEKELIIHNAILRLKRMKIHSRRGHSEILWGRGFVNLHHPSDPESNRDTRSIYIRGDDHNWTFTHLLSLRLDWCQWSLVCGDEETLHTIRKN